jgi:hypothetical protein
VKLFKDAVASQQRLSELLRKMERKESGIADPFEEHRRRPLADHVADWDRAMRHGAGEKHARQFTACVRRLLAECRFEVMADLSASRVQQYLADLKKDRQPLVVDPAKAEYTRAELATLLKIKPCTVTSIVARHRLAGHGEGKRRRYPRGTVESLVEMRCRGKSVRTSNLHLAAIKAFCRWMVKDRRMGDSPLEHLEGGNARVRPGIVGRSWSMVNGTV